MIPFFHDWVLLIQKQILKKNYCNFFYTGNLFLEPEYSFFKWDLRILIQKKLATFFLMDKGLGLLSD